MLISRGASSGFPNMHDCLAVGDSYSYFSGSANDYRDFYPYKLQETLRLLRCNVSLWNKATSGFTSAQVLNLANGLSAPIRPAIGFIYCGTNDQNTPHIATVQASPAPTTTVFAVDAGKGATFIAGAYLVSAGESRQVQSVSADTITLTSALTNPPSVGAQITLDTTTNIVATGNRLVALGYASLVVGLHHYMNFSVGGDTLSTPVASGVTLRGWQTAAATTLGATVADFYTYMRNRIVAGIDASGDFAWHLADGNTHLNAYGEGILASCIAAVLPAASYGMLRS